MKIKQICKCSELEQSSQWHPVSIMAKKNTKDLSL